MGLGLYMGVYYGCTADFTSSTGRSLAIITIVVHVLLIAVLVGFALINPGFIPKIDL